MAASHITLPTDVANTGKELQTWDNIIGGQDVYAEAVVLVDSTGVEKGTAGNPVRVDPTGTTVQPISGTVTAINPSVGTDGSSAPTSSTQIGSQDGSGNLQAASATNPIPTTNPTIGQQSFVTPVFGTVLGYDIGGSLQIAGRSNPFPIGLFDSNGSAIEVGSAGFDSPTALSVQGITGGTPVPISGTITATNPSVGTIGAATPTSATLAGGTDGTDLRGLLTDSTGQLKVLIENSPAVTVTGTVAVTQSGTWNVGLSTGSNTVGKVDILGNAGATLDAASSQNVASPTNGLLTLGQFNTSPATISSGNVSPLQMDASGNLLVNIKAGSSGNAAAGLTGSSVPTSGDYQGINVGGTLRGATGVNPSGTVYAEQMDVTSVAGTTAVTATAGVLKVGISGNTGTTLDGTAGSPSAGVLTVQGVTGATPVLVAGTGTAGTPGTAVLTVQGIASGTAIPASIAAGSGSVINVRSTSSGSNPIDNQASTSFLQNSASSGTVPLYVGDSVYGGAFSGTANAALQGWSKMRTPTVFKTVSATASGNTAIWTPGTGNKFRLLKFIVDVTANASQTSGGVITISFQDATTAMNIAFDVFVPTTAVTTQEGGYTSGWVDLGAFGILSATANNALNVNLSAAFGTGNARVTVAGTEE